MYFYTLEAHADIDWSLASCYIFELSLETTPQVGLVMMMIMMIMMMMIMVMMMMTLVVVAFLMLLMIVMTMH